MKRKAFSLILTVLISGMAGGTAMADALEVTQPIQVTDDEYYERGQSIVYDGSNYWLFYCRSTSCNGNYQNSNPDGNDYQIYYKKAPSVPELATATATQVTAASGVPPSNVFNGETSCVYFESKVWTFASVPSPNYANRNAIYGWYTADGTTWTSVGPYWDNKLSGSLHHDTTVFGGELWVVEGAADGDFRTRHGDPYNPGTPAWTDSEEDVKEGSGGLIHFFQDGVQLYMAALRAGAPRANVVYEYDTSNTQWNTIARVSSSGWDPTLFKVGGTYVFAQAPCVGEGGGRQYVIAYSNNVLDDIFADALKMVSEGRYGSNTWTDMWPIGFTDASGNSYLFYTSERDQPDQEGTGNIWYLSYVWNPSRAHYTYIREAVDASLAGDTINVAAGTYAEAVTIGKANLALQSESKWGAVIRPDTTPVGWPEAVIYISADGVTVDGFEIDGTTVCDNGILGWNTSGLTIKNNKIHGAVRKWDGCGILLFSWGNTGTVYDNLIENNEVYDTGRMGIMVMDYGGAQNTYTVTSGNTITGNTVHDVWKVTWGDHGGGIQINVAKNCSITNNVVYDVRNDQRGIYMFGSAAGNTITGNTLRDNPIGIQLWISGEGGTTIDWGGETPTSPQVRYNNIYGNSTGAISSNIAGTPMVMDATCNWWGHPSGPSGVGSGLGDAVSDHVDYGPPWLLAPAPGGACGIWVQIDIKPGSGPNSINLKSKGVVPVAVLTTSELDASDIDPVTVLFAGATPLRWTMEDVDGDGDMDLLFHFKTQDLNLTGDSKEAVLTGMTGGTDIMGIDTVRIVPGSGKPKSEELDILAVAEQLQVLPCPNPVRDVYTTTFRVMGSAASIVEAIRVRIFDLSGGLVWEDETVGSELDWHVENLVGDYLANGMYLYQVSIKIDGMWISKDIGKIAVLR